ncbi:hypothetical protein VUR80DRAFT_6735 [Thermomyces stellatus]
MMQSLKPPSEERGRPSNQSRKPLQDGDVVSARSPATRQRNARCSGSIAGMASLPLACLPLSGLRVSFGWRTRSSMVRKPKVAKGANVVSARRKNHAPEECMYVKLYKQNGGEGRITSVFKKRCRDWLEAENQTAPTATAPTAIAPTPTAPAATAPTKAPNPRKDCYICQGVGHEPEQCEFLMRYRETGGTRGGVPWLMLDRCMQLPLPAGEKALIEAGQLPARCYICREPNHEAEACEMLKLHIEHNGMTDGQMPMAVKQRCITWLTHEGPPVLSKVQEAPQEECSVCRRRGHSTQDCKTVGRYKRFGENTRGLDDSTKKRCQAFLSNAAAPQKTTPGGVVAKCEICGVEGHASAACRLLRRYRIWGENSAMTARVKANCRAWLRKTRWSPQKGGSTPKKGGPSPTKGGSSAGKGSTAEKSPRAGPSSLSKSASPRGRRSVSRARPVEAKHTGPTPVQLKFHRQNGDGASNRPTPMDKC